MKPKVVLALLLASLVFLTAQSAGAQKSKNEAPRLPSITGKVTLLEPRFFSSTIQVKKTGRKGGLQSVRAIVNSKTGITYKRERFSFKEITLNSTVHLEYERVNGVIVARTLKVKKLYAKPAPSKNKSKGNALKKKSGE